MNVKPSNENARAGRLALPAGMPLGEALHAAFANILAYARSWAREGSSDPVTAVHEYRKSLRRARSLLRLTQRFMGTKAHGELSSTLRELHRATSAQRDRDVVLDTLEGLELAEQVPGLAARLQDATGGAGASRSDAGGQGDGSVSTLELLRRGVERLEPLPAVFAGGLPPKLEWRHLSEGVQRTYRRARRDMHQALHCDHEEAIHDWRKRNKELVYQIELLTSLLASKRERKLRRRLAKLSEGLGQIIDLFVLRHFVEKHAEGEEKERVLAEIARAEKARLERVLVRAARLMDKKPRAFARDIIASARSAQRSTHKADSGRSVASNAKRPEPLPPDRARLADGGSSGA